MSIHYLFVLVSYYLRLYFLSFVLSICLPFCWFLYFLLIFHTSSKFGIEGYNANKLPLGKISKSTISKVKIVNSLFGLISVNYSLV